MRWLALFWMTLAVAFADASNTAAGAARKWRESRERAIVEEFTGLLSIPNVARNLDDMRRNAAYIRQMMDRRGIRNELLETPNAPPAIYGEILTPGAAQTILFYAHYDGQPVEPSEWQNSSPFRPVLRTASIENGGRIIPLPAKTFDPEARIYARSSGDDKAPIVSLLTAVDAIRAARLPLKSNIRFFFDGEEEAGSPHLKRILEKYKAKLGADVWIFCDGPVHPTRKQLLAFGARGTTGLNLTIYGPVRELHSGHYGNWAPNPAAMLARIVASMRDDEGRILIPGFYDDVEPLSEADRRALAAVPNMEEELRKELGLARTEGNGLRLEELITLPALNIRGLSAAGVGAQSRNVIPSSATASIDLRLVSGMDHQRASVKVIAHVQKQGYRIVYKEPDEAMRLRHPKICLVSQSGGYNAVRAPMDSPISKKIIEAVRSARGEVILMPTMGGSLPIAPVSEVLKAPVILVPMANHDNNQHAHNENIRIQNLWDGIEMMAALLALE